MHPITYKLDLLVKEYKEKGYSDAYIRNILKEYLQDIILYIIYNDSKYKNLIFYGGTCLRKIYNLNRLSEDLDFETNIQIDLEDLKNTFLTYFKNEKFDLISASIQKSEHINRCTLKFEVLYKLNLADIENEKLHVKVEISENTLNDFNTEVTPYTKDIYNMVIKHYTLETLMAGKMLACINRVYRKGDTGVSIKGRDFYDLVWYMQKEITPNEYVFKDFGKSKDDIFKELDDIVLKIKTKDLLIDLEPLFESNIYIKEWCNNFNDLYNKYRGIYK